MGAQGLEFNPVNVAFIAGLKTRESPQAMKPSGLDIATDVEFDEWGALRTRKPYAQLGVNILGGGTVSNFRRIVENGNELVLFTQTGLYSWDADATAWVSRGTHMAVSLVETPAFATTDDQIDIDRAELGGVIFYAWTGTANASTTNVYIAALDKTTGAVIVGPMVVTFGSGGSRPKLVALQTKVLLLFVANGGGLNALALDPANVASSMGASPSTVENSGNMNSYYDVVQQIGADVALVAYRRQTTTAYSVATITSGLSIAHATPSRTCDGPIAVACSPDGTQVMVVRGNGTAVQADLITISTLVDTAVINKTLVTVASTPVNQIAAAFRTDGTNRCYAFISSNENAANTSAFSTQSNYCDTSGTLGSAGTIAGWCGVGSRAFPYGGFVYAWLTFGQTCGDGQGGGSAFTTATGNFQNAYFLVRDDGLLCAKSVYESGGGLAPSTGRLPGVALTSGSTTFSVCLNKRRKIAIGAGTGAGAQTPASSNYAMREPLDVVFTFDSNLARQCYRLGKTLYIPAGEVMQYDGTALCEVGFHVYPWYINGFASSGGNLTASAGYGYKSTWRWYNAQGESERSTTATLASTTLSSSQTKLSTAIGAALPVTHKAANLPALEVWRTLANPPAAAPFYLVTDQNPANSGASNNPYVPASLTGTGPGVSFNDTMADSVAAINELNNENGGILANLAPPAAQFIAASPDRLFLAGIAGDPDAVYYSLLRTPGQVAAFNDALVFRIPQLGGAITGLAMLQEVLYVFRQRAIYAVPGDGNDNAGGGSNYGPAQLVSSDVGAVNQDSIALGPFGLIFQTSKGWYILDPGRNLQYVGAGVAAFDAEAVAAIHVVPGQHQVRAVTSGRILVYDYLAKEWSTQSVAGAAHACIWQGQYVYLDPTNGPMLEQTSLGSGVTYGLDVETGWIKLNDLQGRGYVRNLQVLGEYRGAHQLRIRIARDYQLDNSGNPLYFDDYTWNPSSTVVGGPEQVRHGPSQKRFQALKVRLTAVGPSGSGVPSTDSLTLTGLVLDMAVEPGIYSGIAPAQRV
jgi:hypothetical protein